MTTRRRMIVFAGTLLAALVGVGGLVVRSWLPWITRGSDGRWRLGARARFPEGSATLLRRANAIVVNTGAEVYALTAICTHERCTVRPTRARREIVCPCHGAAFDFQGRVLRGPAQRDLHRLALSEEGGELVLDARR